jgi:hypothetical protein
VLRIPRAPGALELVVERHWNGEPLRDARLRGVARLQTTPDGVAFEASLPHQREPRVPTAPAGTRVGDLWEYDVVECFMAGRDGSYLELELGAGGHFLALRFAAPRRCSDTLESLEPALSHRADARGWSARLVAPWSVVPAEIVALNVFVAAGGELLAHAPLPGPQPDFHQPQRFPAARLEGDPR